MGLEYLISRYKKKDWVKYIERRVSGAYRRIMFVYKDNSFKAFRLTKDKYIKFCKSVGLKELKGKKLKTYRLIKN